MPPYRNKWRMQDQIVSDMTGGLTDYVQAGGDWLSEKISGQGGSYQDLLQKVLAEKQQYKQDNPWKARIGSAIGHRLNPVGQFSRALSGAKAGESLVSQRDKEYVGYPPDVTDRKDLGKLRKTLKTAAELGADKRFWYKDSGQAMLKAAHGDMPRARKVGNFTAITSPGANVKTNTGFGTQMYYQDLVGDRLSSGKYPTEMGKKGRMYAEQGEGYIGPKRDPFFNDIMGEIDPSLPQDTVTADMWMGRLFGTDSDALKTTETRTIIKEVQRVAKKLGWKPKEAQAAMWSVIKGKWESIAGEVKAKGVKKGWGEAELRTQLRKAALKADIPPQVLKAAGYSFKEGLEDQTGHIGIEAVPSRAGNVLPWLHDAPLSVRNEYTDKIIEATGDDVERELGILTQESSDAEGLGSFTEDGKTSYNPSKQQGVVIPVAKGGQKAGKMDPSARKAVEVLAAIKGRVWDQDSVGYGKSFVSTQDKANQFQVDIGRDMTDPEQQEFMQMVENHPDLQATDKDGNLFPAVWFSPANDGITINYFGGENKGFVKTLKGIIGADNFMPGEKVTGDYAMSDGDLIGGDTGGNTYDEVIRRNGAQAKERKISASVSPKIEKVKRDFARKHGQADPFPDRFSGPSVQIPRRLNSQFPLRKGVADYGARLSDGDRYVDRHGLPQAWRTRKSNKSFTSKTAYHGTNSDIQSFDKSKIRPADYDIPVNGFWFSSNPDTASPAFRNPSNIMPVELALDNPAPFQKVMEVARQVDKDQKWRKGARSSDDETRMRLQDMGHDGVIPSGVNRKMVDTKKLEKERQVVFKDARGQKKTLKYDDNPKSPGYGGLDLYDGTKAHENSHVTGYYDFEDFIKSSGGTDYLVFEPKQIRGRFVGSRLQGAEK